MFYESLANTNSKNMPDIEPNKPKMFNLIKHPLMQVLL